MKILIYLIVFVIMVLLVLFDIKNINVPASYICFNNVLYNTTTAMIVTFAFLAGIITGVLYNFINLINSKKMGSAQNKRVEKMVVDKESADLKVQTLEAKIKTLEKALQKALNKES